MNEQTTKRINVYGIQRSGNHALISWIFDHHDGVVVHLNDVADIRDPWKTFYQIRVKGLPYYRCHRNLRLFARHKLKGWLKKQHDLLLTAGHDAIELDYISSYPKIDCTIASCENKCLSHLNGPSGKDECIRNLVILRDPFNLLASLCKSKIIEQRGAEFFVTRYKEYARFYLNRPEDSNIIFLNYNQWVSDSDYHIKKAHQLGFENDGGAYENIAHQGGGSSFDEQKFQQNASGMSVFERWKYLKGNQHYGHLLDDEELRDLNEKIFSRWVNLND